MKIGKDVRIAETAQFKTPDLIELGNHVAIDTGVSCTTRLKAGNYVHIAPYVCIIGGAEALLECGDFVGIGAGSKIICATDDIKQSLLSPIIPVQFRKIKTAPVIFKKYSGTGVNAVVMPGVTLGEGSFLGANSFLNQNAEPWTLYAGNPAKKVGFRDKQEITKNAALVEGLDAETDSLVEGLHWWKD